MSNCNDRSPFTPRTDSLPETMARNSTSARSRRRPSNGSRCPPDASPSPSMARARLAAFNGVDRLSLLDPKTGKDVKRLRWRGNLGAVNGTQPRRLRPGRQDARSRLRRQHPLQPTSRPVASAVVCRARGSAISPTPRTARRSPPACVISPAFACGTPPTSWRKRNREHVSNRSALGSSTECITRAVQAPQWKAGVAKTRHHAGEGGLARGLRVEARAGRQAARPVDEGPGAGGRRRPAARC